jgi:hypothetical protein
MLDQTSFKLISGFLGLLILGFIIFIITGTIHINESERATSAVVENTAK